MTTRTRKEPDIGWTYGTLVEGTKSSVRCNFCFFVSTGGITRHKHHLAWDSPDVLKCPKVPAEVKELMKEQFEKKKRARELIESIPHFDEVVDIDDYDEDEIPSNRSEVQSKGKKTISSTGSTANTKKTKGPLDYMFKPSSSSGKKGGNLVGSVEHNEVQKKLRLDAVQKFARWMYDAGLSFNAVKYDSLGPALEAVGRYGCGMKPPSYHEVRVPMLKLEMEHTKKILQENEVEKSTYGCSLMADGWRDRKGRALINFLVNTPRGSMFIESVDASSYSHTGENMFKLFDRFIKKVGPDHIIQIVTDSASNNVLAGQLVEEKYPHIYWTPCAAHCIDLMFEDIFKLAHLKRALERAIAVNTYIYNRTLLLNMMRDFTGQKDMVRPAKTRFATAFITLSCFKANKRNLRKLFTSEEWNKSKFSKEVGGKQTANTILLPSFWNNVNIAVKVGGPLLGVLRLVDGERKPPMGYIYEAMDRAKEMIAASFKNKKEKYQEIFNIIDARWNCQLHRPLHAAGHYLNPSLMYYNNIEANDDDEVVSGLMSCISKLTLNEDEQIKIHSELPLYRRAEGIFGNPMAKKMRAKLAPAVWWMQYGASAPTLKKFAIKVLSLTCSSSGCERNWSVFEHVQSFVYVMSEEGTRLLAYLEDMYEDRKGQKKVKVRWFHHTQEVQAAITLKNPHPKEVFITPYAQVISVECVDGPALVLAREHYDICVSTLPEDLLTRVHLCSRQFKNNRVKPFKLSKLCGYFDQPVFLVLDTDFLEDEENSDGDIVKLGAKRLRGSSGRHVTPCDSSCMDVRYETLRRKLIPKHVKYMAPNIMGFKVNEKIELLSLDSGIRGCWFRCTIMQVTRRQLKVQYDDLKDEGGSGNLEEWVPAFRLAMPDKLGIRCSGRPTTRPARMEDEANFAIEVGSPVDGWWSDGWWEGVVTGIGGGDVKVYVPGENMFLELHIKNIRLSRDWVGDHWVKLETKPNILSLIPANNNEVKPGSSPVSSKETPKPVDPDHVDPEHVDPEHVEPEPEPPQEGDPDPEFHEKDNDPSLGLDNDLQIVEQGEHTGENREA